ncbi:hypothetical protein pb186bvf_002507 [Paramecium bursaria]
MKKISRSMQMFQPFQNQVLGYNLKTNHGVSYSFRTSRDIPRFKQFTPGPGRYQIESRSNTGMKFSSSKRDWKYIKTQPTPGPGEYEIREFAQTKTVKWNQSQKKTPNTTIQSYIDSLQSFNSVQKHGSLLPKFRSSIRKFEFLDTLNVPTPKPIDRSPGPGKYLVVLRNPKKITFTKQSRPELFTIPKTPGVGSYSQLRTFGKDYSTYKKKKEPKQYSISIIEI